MSLALYNLNSIAPYEVCKEAGQRTWDMCCLSIGNVMYLEHCIGDDLGNESPRSSTTPAGELRGNLAFAPRHRERSSYYVPVFEATTMIAKRPLSYVRVDTWELRTAEKGRC